MGLFDTPKDARDFVIEAESVRDAIVTPANERRRKMRGKHWRRTGFGADIFVNSYFNLYKSVVPAMVSKAPIAQVKCDNPSYGGGIGQQIADALEQGLDANSEQTRVHAVYRDAVASSLFDFGCTYTGMEPVPGYENRLAQGAAMQAGWMPPPMRPRTWLIHSGMAFTDPLEDPFNGVGCGHVWIANKDELKSVMGEDGRPKFDPAALDAMAIDSDADTIRQKMPYGDWVRRTAKRGDVVGYTLWCRATQTEYTFAYTAKYGSQDQQWLCEPVQSVVDDPDGPYTFWGMFWFEGEPYPYPITAAIQQIVDSRDLHRRKIDDDARSALRFVVADGKKNAMKVAQARNKRILNWPGFAGKFAVVDLGGPQPASSEYEEKLRREESEMTAVSQNRLGNQDPNVPATAILDTAQELDAQKAFARESVRIAASAELRKRARIMYTRESVQFQFGELDEFGNEVTATFRGGILPDEMGLAFDDFRFDVDPFLGHQAEANAIARFGQITETAVQIRNLAMDPAFNVENLANDAFADLNVRGGARRYLHLDVLERQQEMAAMGAGAANVGALAAPGQAVEQASPSRKAAGKTPGAGDVRSVAARIGANTKQAEQGRMSVQVAGAGR